MAIISTKARNTLLIGLLVSVAMLVVAFGWMNPPQCGEGNPTSDGNCIIGANIGLGLWLLLTTAVWMSVLVATCLIQIISLSRRWHSNKMPKIILACMVAAVIVAALTYAGFQLTLVLTDNLVKG